MKAISTYIIILLCASSLVGQDLKIVSWNIKDFGQSRDAAEISMIAEVVKHADIVAVQEVVAKDPGGAQAVARLADELNRKGAKWDYRISDPTQSPSSHKSERYAYLWKSSKVSITGGRPSLITSLATVVDREPYLIQFKYKGEILTIINYHACTHKKHFPERAEIQYISDWLMQQSYDNVIWAGDMNLEIGDQAFDAIIDYGYTNVLNGQKTSLKKSCKSGNYLSSAEDNILISLQDFKVKHTAILDFIGSSNCTDVEWKRTSLSDHLGVEVEIGL